MKASDAIKAFIKNEEGCRLQAYKDIDGNLTIGVGHLMVRGSLQDVITQEQADTLFENDIEKAEAGLAVYVKAPVTQNEYDALISLIFNIGVQAFANSIMHQYANKGDWIEVAGHMLNYCHDNNGAVVSDLLKRRIKEAAILLGIERIGYVNNDKAS